MKLIEEILLPNGLKLNIFDLSREIAKDTVKVEIIFKTEIGLRESFFLHKPDYLEVKNIFGDKLVYEYKAGKAYVKKEKSDAIRGELINTFKSNSLCYLGAENFAAKLAAAMLKDIRKNPYKYQIKKTET